MSDLLDLCITLTSPPADAPSGTIATIDLRCDTLGLSHSGDLLADPLTDRERADLHWYLEEYWQWPYEGFAERGQMIEASLPQIGRRLFESVFGSLPARDLMQAWRLQAAQPGYQGQISILSDIPAALSLPWELLHDEQGFLVLRTRQPISILRRLQLNQLGALLTSFKPPLRVLLVTARPEGTGFVDPRSIARELLDAMEEQIESGAIDLEFLHTPTLATLRHRLAATTRPVHVLHFDGHGIFTAAQKPELPGDEIRLSGGGRGMLAFEDADGKLDLVSAETLAQVLQDSGVKLAVLTACQSAMSGGEDAFSSVAGRLIRGGLDAVVAMSTSVLVVTATYYSEAFYRELALGITVPVAHERARQILYDNPKRHVLRRRLDDQGAPINLQDWWLPHYYQQRTLRLAPRKVQAKHQKSLATASRMTNFPGSPRYGWSGRARELLEIKRHLAYGRLVVIRGLGGVGKTALAREVADWLTRTKMFATALFVSFEHGGDVIGLLSALGHHLEIYDSAYNPSDIPAALAKLHMSLAKRRLALVADNVESLLPGGETPLDDTERTRLWDVLLELQVAGVGVLLTTRDINLSDARLAPSHQVRHLPLGGLQPNDSYILASRLLDDLQIPRANVPYTELRDLLTQIDHHPLAIQLVLPTLRDLPISTVRTDLTALLPTFQDDTTTGRNRSLLASLDYSLNKLTDSQRALLARLAPFEGCATVPNLLAITEISENEWTKLQEALEKISLITFDEVDSSIIPQRGDKFFLRFHPTLSPFLRSQTEPNTLTLNERYADIYHGIMKLMYQLDYTNPHFARSVVLHELPNLRRTLELLLKGGKLEEAVDMSDSLTHFLSMFGREREINNIRDRIADAVADLAPSIPGPLTLAEYQHEAGLAQDDYRRDNIQEALIRFESIVNRIEALPKGAPLGPGSFEHCQTLERLARCWRAVGQLDTAESFLQKAQEIIETLATQDPYNSTYSRWKYVILSDIGYLFIDQGRYAQASAVYNELLRIAEESGDSRSRQVAYAQLGLIALKQNNLDQSERYYRIALDGFQRLGEPTTEAAIWVSLGQIAAAQGHIDEAEQCYRTSITLYDKLGADAKVATLCNELSVVVRRSGRLYEAEQWLKRALEINQRIGSNLGIAFDLNNLASVLTASVREGIVPVARLTEAKAYAEQALLMKDSLGPSGQPWTVFYILADIAELQEQVDEVQNYRQQGHESFAAFEGNRTNIDGQFGHLISSTAAAAKGVAPARTVVEEAFPSLEAKGLHSLPHVIERILDGERNWARLTNDSAPEEALFVLRVLETLGDPHMAPEGTLTRVLADAPTAAREAYEQGDIRRFYQIINALPPTEALIIDARLQQLLIIREFDEEGIDISKPLHQLEPVLQAIVAVALGNEAYRATVEGHLSDLEETGWHITEVVRRLWNGERDLKTLAEGLDLPSALVALRLLELVVSSSIAESHYNQRQATTASEGSDGIYRELDTLAKHAEASFKRARTGDVAALVELMRLKQQANTLAANPLTRSQAEVVVAQLEMMLADLSNRGAKS